jgi:hypothetical protein
VLVFSNLFGGTYLSLDTILQRTMSAAETHNRLVDRFEAEIYTRTYVETVRRNFLYRHAHLIPRLVLHDPKNDEALIETLSTLRFEYPNNYALDIRHVTGTLTGRRDIGMIPFNMLNINVYGETTNDESFFMPTRFSTARYYNYRLYGSFVENSRTHYIIYFTPIYENPKLLSGHFIVESDTWRITFFRGEGQAIFSNFSFEITMGNEWITNFLPQDFVIHETVSFLGNVVESRHLARITYKNITLRQIREPYRSLNISDFYRIRLDSVPVYSNPDFWNEIRPIPLEEREKNVLLAFQERERERMLRQMGDTIPDTQRMQQFAQRMVMNTSYRHRSTRIDYSGLLNPFMLSYSTYDGLTYRQRLTFNFDLYRERTLNISAFAGYMFRRREFFSDITTTFNYNPFRMGSLTLSIGNGNPSFSSLFIDQVQDSLRLSGITFGDISLLHYRNYYLRLFNTIEISNGLLLNTGVEYHIRTAIRNEDVVLPPGASDNVEDLFRTRRAFVPFVRVTWTPEQYHRFEGRQKIHVRSRFPTFKLELSRSFQNILGSTSEYNRLEFDVNHSISFGLMRSINYHVGAGMFINQRTEYFADFTFFSKSNFPESWNDGVGGVFNLLGRDLYNASDSYIQAHLMYETPFLLLRSVPFVSDFANRERLYFSQLYTPQIISYTELGYGIGNRFFNTAIFASFHRTNFRSIGARIVFEL